MTRDAKYLLVIMTFLGFAGQMSVCSASDPTRDRLGPFRVRTWTSEDGLPQNQVSCLKQTRDGYLWIGTYFGVGRLDGLGLTVFTSANTPALTNNTINSLTEDREGVLWVGTSGGLLRYSNYAFAKVALPVGLTNVIEIVPARSGGVWLHANESVVQFKNAVFSKVWKQDVQDPAQIICIAESTNGALNIFTRDSWLQIAADSSRQRTIAVKPSSGPNWLAALLEETSGSALVGTRDGIFRVAAGRYEPFAATEIGAKFVDRIFGDGDGNLWIDVKGAGVFLKKWGRWQMLDLGEGFEHESNLNVQQDREGSIWLGTRNGLIQLREPLVTSYSTRQGLSHNKVWSVCETRDGSICAGTESGISLIQPNGTVETHAAANGNGGFPERLVWPASDGGFYTARNKMGLFKFRPGEASRVIAATALPGPVTSLWENSSGVFFVAGEGGIVTFTEKSAIPWDAATNLIPVQKAYTIFQETDGTLWCGTDGLGLARVQGGKVSWFRQAQGLPSDSVWSICADGAATLWLGTDRGLVRFKDGRFAAVTCGNGLREDIINCLLRDNADGLWLSGQHGIYRVSLTELNLVADGRSKLIQPFALGTGDGMETPETNGGKQPAGWKARDGKLWFPTMRGVVSIDPKRIPVGEPPPPVRIQQVRADDRIIYGDFNRTVSTSKSGTVEVKPGQGRVVEFVYTANSFVDPKGLRFKHRLTGTGNSWSAETTDRTARYINLKPGDYTFEVIGANSHNVWSQTAAAFSFYLAPHFWETWTFYFLTGCGLIGMAIGIQAYRLRWQHRLMLIKQEAALAAERTRIARDLHDDVGTALTGLALELDVAGRDSPDGSSVPGRLHESATITRNLAERIRQVVWTVNPNCDNVPSLVTFLEQQVSQFLRSDRIRLRLDFPDEIPDLFLGGAARYQVALVVREALTNVVRHSQATEVTLSLKVENQPAPTNERGRGNGAAKLLVVKVKDNGRGMVSGSRPGNGFSNMKTRVEKIGGKFECVSVPGAGTTLSFIVPVPKDPKTV